MKNKPEETLNSVVKRLVKDNDSDYKLCPETIRDIEKGVADIKAGRTYTTEELN